MRSCHGIKNVLNIKYPSLFSVYPIIRDGSLFITVGSLRTERVQINNVADSDISVVAHLMFPVLFVIDTGLWTEVWINFARNEIAEIGYCFDFVTANEAFGTVLKPIFH